MSGKTSSVKLLNYHPEKLALLEKIVLSNNIPHAFLFSGLKGIGKKEVAVRFAEMILSIGKSEPVAEQSEDAGLDLFGMPVVTEKPKNNDSLINKEVSDRIKAGTHADLHLIEKNDDDKKNIGVDEVRNINKFLSLTPAESQYRVAIIDSINDFNINSSNAILKILEEPTRNTILLILCHSTAGILQTIKSRCVELKFAPLNIDQFKEVLANNSDDDLNSLYELSGGSSGIANEIIDSNARETLEKYLKLLNSKVVNITDISSISKEIKENASWKLFSQLLIKNYSDKINEDKNYSKLDTLEEINKIIYLSDFQNMDIQDTLKNLTQKII